MTKRKIAAVMLIVGLFAMAGSAAARRYVCHGCVLHPDGTITCQYCTVEED